MFIKHSFSQSDIISYNLWTRRLNIRRINRDNKNNSKLLDSLLVDILDDLPKEALFGVANLDESKFRGLQLVQGQFLKYRLKQFSEQRRDKLLEECRERSGDSSLSDAGASRFILRELWQQLA